MSCESFADLGLPLRHGRWDPPDATVKSPHLIGCCYTSCSDIISGVLLISSEKIRDPRPSVSQQPQTDMVSTDIIYYTITYRIAAFNNNNNNVTRRRVVLHVNIVNTSNLVTVKLAAYLCWPASFILA